MLDVSQAQSLSLTTMNQTFFANNERAISQFFGTVTPITQRGFYLLKASTIKTLEQDVKYV